MKPLTGKVAVVTGASRGAGRGIAGVLGEHGASVYVTGRSVRGHQLRSDLPNTTIEDTADYVTARGGTCIPVRCDHTVDAEIEALFAQVTQEHGKLDILVNNAWGGYEGYDATFDAPFWEQPISRFDNMFRAGVRSHLVTTRYALPLMFNQPHGLIINTTLEIDPTFYDMALFYRTTKLAINYMTFGMAYDLYQRSGYPIAAIALAPGWMRTEEVLDMFDKGIYVSDQLAETESVEYIGRAVLALATDPNVLEKSGKTLRVRDLAREYGFTDSDGRQPS
jgi:NAD(P)-dependent dehydrogenase (short-subunit alcohol dehydrogenase family)